MTHVIESQDYRDEESALKADPIIQAMAASIPPAHRHFVDDGRFMTQALNEYHRRGGQNARSIGGPARAIRALLEEES